jgi:G3E family GTPase
MNDKEQKTGANIPVTVLTGFLGSGKTTILNAVITKPSMRGAAVIINEFGEIGLDHEFIESSNEELVLISNGCVCCTVRGDLVSTLSVLSEKSDRGEIPSLNRVFLETTGLADPAPILHTLMSEPSVTARYWLDNVVTTVDAVHAHSTLDKHAEAVKQVAVADRMLLTKSDLTSPGDLAKLRDRLAAINPGAEIREVIKGDADPSDLIGSGRYDPESKTANVQEWLRAEEFEEHHDHHEHHHVDPNRHNDRIRAYCITRDHPISSEGFSAWLDMVSAMRGDDLLRVKGIVNITEHPSRPMVIHGVQHIFHPPEILDHWPSDDHRTRIVFITRDIDKEAIDDTLRVFERRRRRK